VTLKIGKMGAVPSRHDPKTVNYKAIAKALAIADPRRVPKFQHDTRPHNARWDILGNDEYGCCTFAGIARIMMNNAVRKGHVLNITREHVIKAYLDSTGGIDTGQMPINALNYCRAIGFKLDDGSVVKVVAYARVGDRDPYEQQSAMTTFGSMYVAAGLPLALDRDRDLRWELTPRDKFTTDDEPRSMGGHAYPIFGFQRGEQFSVPWNQEVVEEEPWTSYYREENWCFVDSQETDQLLLGVLYAQLAAIKDTATT
jgi:hypothetical protein